MLVILWDNDGNKVEANFPEEEPQDLLEKPVFIPDGLSASNVQEILNDVEISLGKRIISMHKLGYNHFWNVRRECVVLQWLAQVSDVPTPVVHHVNIEAPIPYMLTSKCSGMLVSDTFGALPEDGKLENVTSFARIALHMFSLPVPQKIGSISQILATGEVVIGDIIPGLPGSHKRQFSTAGEYFKLLLFCRRHSSYIGPTPTDIATAETVLAELERFVQSRLDQLDPSLLRTALVHDDFLCHNVFNDENGVITGIIDWEIHSVKPKFLAASYPTWLRYDGSFAPVPATKGGQFSSFWMASPNDAQRLRDAYDSIVQVQNPEYYRALKAGEHLRVAEEMLLSESSDFGCSDMNGWLKTVLSPPENS